MELEQLQKMDKNKIWMFQPGLVAGKWLSSHFILSQLRIFPHLGHKNSFYWTHPAPPPHLIRGQYPGHMITLSQSEASILPPPRPAIHIPCQNTGRMWREKTVGLVSSKNAWNLTISCLCQSASTEGSKYWAAEESGVLVWCLSHNWHIQALSWPTIWSGKGRTLLCGY